MPLRNNEKKNKSEKLGNILIIILHLQFLQGQNFFDLKQRKKNKNRAKEKGTVDYKQRASSFLQPSLPYLHGAHVSATPTNPHKKEKQ